MAVGIFAALMTLFGCSGKAPNPDGTDSVHQLCSVSYSCGHMVRTSCFTFSLYQKDGEILFDAWCFVETGPDEVEEISIEAVKALPEDFEKLSRIVEQYQLEHYLKHYRPFKPDLMILDKTTYALSAQWSDGVRLSADSAGEAGDALEQFFRETAIRLNRENPQNTIRR